MAFDIQRTRRSLPAAGSGSQGNVNLDTGAGLLARGIGDLGGSIEDATAKLQKLEADNQFSEARRRVSETLNDLYDQFERDPDSSTYDSRFETAMSQMQQFTPKNALAARAYSNMLKTVQTDGQKAVLASKLERERDNFYASRIGEIAAGQFDQARKALAKGLSKGLINATAAQMLANQATTMEKKDAERQADMEHRSEVKRLTDWALMQPTVDEAIDLVRSQGLSKGWDRADITFVEGLVKDDFARSKADKTEAENKRIADTYADFAKRMYVATDKTTTAEVYDANLPRSETDALVSMIRQRDEDIINKTFKSTAPLYRARFNDLLREVSLGEKTANEGVADYFKLMTYLDPSKHEANVDAIFKAAEDSKSPEYRRMQIVLAGREKTLRDAIEADVSAFDDQTDKDYMKNLADEAVNKLNDQFAGISPEKFKVSDLDETVNELIRKYAITRPALLQAKQAKRLLEAETYKEQVDAFQALLRKLRDQGKAAELSAAMDEGIKLGLVNPDGTVPDSQSQKAKPKSTLQTILDGMK